MGQASRRKRGGLADPGLDAVRQYLSASYHKASSIRRNVALLAVHGSPVARRLQELPPCFVDGFLSLIGHAQCPGREFVDWRDYSTSIRLVTDGHANQLSLSTWYKAPMCSIDQVPDPRHMAYGILQQATEAVLTLSYRARLAIFLDLGKSRFTLADTLRSHLHAAGSIAAHANLLRAGSLFLIDTDLGQPSASNTEDALLLVRKTRCGIYMNEWPPSFPLIKASEIKQMRQLVYSYTGRTVKGRFRDLSRHRSQRLCRAIGLAVDGDWATLAPPAP